MLKNIPAISVIVPMYNTEKYIADCLESLLAQTLQDFEVIVVDDCSTDNCAAIVESYAEKFNGRLHLESTNKNSGSGTLPRNIGLKYSRGEYIFFMDNDDAFTPPALEELYSHAKNFNADVIHCEKYYQVPQKFWNDTEFKKKLKPTNYLTQENILVKEPVVWENNFEERVKFFSQRKLIWNIWVQLIRRDFIIKNSIEFVGVMADDMLFTICELCCAKKYVLVPNVVYFYRIRDESLIHKKLNTADHILHYWISMLKEGIKYLDEFLNEREFFLRRPDLKYILFDTFTQEMLGHLNPVYSQIPPHSLDGILRKEFGNDDNTALTTFIFSLMNIYRLRSTQTQYQFNQFAAQAQQRIAQLENELKRLKK